MKLPTLLLLSVVCVNNALAASTDVPARTPNNLIVAAYNIQWIGQRQHELDKLALVIQHFDVCGIVEVKNESSIPELVEELEILTNKDWGYTFGVRTHRPGGRYHEAYAAVWRKDRVELGDGLVGGMWDLEEAFRNDPYIVSFKSGNFDFSMILIHTRWSNDAEGSRENEVAMLAEQVVWMSDFAQQDDFLVAGDFNYSGTAPQMDVLVVEADLTQIDTNEKSTFKTDYSDYASAYDHIYISSGAVAEYTGKSGIYDSTKAVYGNNSKANMKKSKSELSDHLPVWAEFSTN